jgi:hypothetical protein
MDRTRIARLSAALLFLLFAWIAYTQNQGQQPPQLTISKVKDDLYTSKVTAATSLRGYQRRRILVDDVRSRSRRHCREHKSVTNQPVKYAQHSPSCDHSGGKPSSSPR